MYGHIEANIHFILLLEERCMFNSKQPEQDWPFIIWRDIAYLKNIFILCLMYYPRTESIEEMLPPQPLYFSDNHAKDHMLLPVSVP